MKPALTPAPTRISKILAHAPAPPPLPPRPERRAPGRQISEETSSLLIFVHAMQATFAH